MAIQASPHLQAGQNITFDLELLPSTAALSLMGDVVWSDSSGRAGIHFPALPDASIREIEQWLKRNATLNSDHAAPMHAEDAQQFESTDRSMPDFAGFSANSVTAIGTDRLQIGRDYTSILSAIVAVRREVEAKGNGIASALQLLAERAQTLTSATGAAIALLDETDPKLGEMLCSASAGKDAPPLGSRLQIGEGFSGICVRTGKLLVCMDTETDGRVNRESCREFGIRSMVAVPLRAEASVMGILEVFSPTPNAFGSQDSTILQQLAEITLSILRRTIKATAKQPLNGEALSANSAPAAAMKAAPAKSVPRSGPWVAKLLLAVAVVFLAAIVLWLLLPWLHFLTGTSTDYFGDRSPTSQHQILPNPTGSAVGLNHAIDVQSLADQGDSIAQFDLGVRYATGDGVAQDYSQAAKWFLRAAEQGHVVAQAQLGAYYLQGRGVPQNLDKAYFWSILARAGGDEGSKIRVAQIASRMDRVHQLSLQNDANNWLKQHASESAKTP